MSQYEPAEAPFNTDPPTDLDRVLDRTLTAYTDKEIILESDEGMQLRDRLLLELERIFQEWVKYVAEFVLKLPEDEVAECGGQLFVSGSHRLGIKEPGADIDTVCVAPNFCTREHFFSSLKARFLAHPEVTELSSIETSRVPIIAFDFYGISIDLLFAKLAENCVPPNVDIFNDDILRNLDNASEISLNGPRVTDMIRKLVPKYDSFVFVLRCVRKWAKVKGLYGNKFGYLGGVNFNLLLAFVCQLYPNASPSHLLVRFFRVYSLWKWPAPVMLNKLHPNPPGENRDVWSKEAAHYNRHANMMPIITPAYPAANSAYNVSEHTLKVMDNEFRAANDVVRSIVAKKENADWSRLFTPSDFFISYNHYLLCHIIGSVTGEDDAEAARGWVGFVESRLRWVPTILAQGLQLSAVHLHPKVVKSDKGTMVSAYYVGFNVAVKGKKGEEKVLRVDQCISEFRDQHLGQFRKGEGNVTNTFIVEHFTWKNLPESVFESLGGKVAAKEKRRAKFKRTAPAIKVEALAADTTSTEVVKTEEQTENKKRRLSEGQSEAEADSQGSKRVRTSTDEITVVSRINDGDGILDFSSPSARGEDGMLNKSRLSKSEHMRIASELPDLSGRYFEPKWRRSNSIAPDGDHNSAHHHNYDSKPIHVTWSLLEKN